MHCREGNSAARRLFRCCLTSVKKSGVFCAVIVTFVRLSCSCQFLSCPLSVSRVFVVRYSELGEVRLEGAEECGEGSAAVAEGEFGFDVEFGHGLAVAGQVEERVVAEAVSAAGLGEDIAFAGAVADGEDVPVASAGEDAVVAGAALGEGNAGGGGGEAHAIPLSHCITLRTHSS